MLKIYRTRDKLLTRAGREFIQLARDIFSGVRDDQILTQFRFGSFQ